jgi:hypothetical protein
MADDLPPLVRAAYNNATMSLRGETAAFDHAVEAILKRRPLLSEEQAREAAAAMLGLADAVPRDADDAA